MSHSPDNLRQIESLVEIVSRLRGANGCPWDQAQTHESLTQYAIEETHELVEVLEMPSSADRDRKMQEELGDVLFQVVLHAQLASERGAFHLSDVIANLSEKLLRRHPHVFGTAQVKDAAAVEAQWESIKRQEAGTRTETSATDLSLQVPPLPALQRAYKIGKRTEKLKFDWENAAGAWLKVEEEVAELQEALDSDIRSDIEHELGDVFFSLSQLARHLDMEPEQILRIANRRFETRFNKMVELIQAQGLVWENLSLDEKDIYWVQAKKLLKALS